METKINRIHIRHAGIRELSNGFMWNVSRSDEFPTGYNEKLVFQVFISGGSCVSFGLFVVSSGINNQKLKFTYAIMENEDVPIPVSLLMLLVLDMVRLALTFLLKS